MKEEIEIGLRLVQMAQELSEYAIKKGWKPQEFYFACTLLLAKAIKPNGLKKFFKAFEVLSKAFSQIDLPEFTEEEIKRLKDEREYIY